MLRRRLYSTPLHLVVLLMPLVACSAGRSDTTSECLCAADSSVGDADAACDDKQVLVYPRPGCGTSVAPVCVDPADTGCVNIVCGCDGKIHIWACEGPREPFAFRWEGSGGSEGDPCGDAGADASGG
jgi:zona occludens toxin (predicted ATPase)